MAWRNPKRLPAPKWSDRKDLPATTPTEPTTPNNLPIGASGQQIISTGNYEVYPQHMCCSGVIPYPLYQAPTQIEGVVVEQDHIVSQNKMPQLEDKREEDRYTH